MIVVLTVYGVASLLFEHTKQTFSSKYPLEASFLNLTTFSSLIVTIAPLYSPGAEQSASREHLVIGHFSGFLLV